MKGLIQYIRNAWHERAIVLKAASFASVGAVNTIVDFVIFWIANQYFGMSLVAANVLGWVVAVTNSYVLNTFVTFAHESNRELRWRAYLTFFAVGIVGLIVNTSVLLLAASAMPRFIASPAYQVAAAKLCAICASFLVNFALSNFVVFRRRTGQPH